MESCLKDELWWLLSQIENLGPRRAARLKEIGGIKAIWQADAERLSACGLSKRQIEEILKGPDLRLARTRLQQWEDRGIFVISADHPLYPQLLKQIYDPPVVLYVIGKTSLLQTPMMAVVGARKATAYGERAAQEVARALVHRGYTVVSGMADGIDSASHQGALSADGGTVAVMGCGVDICYPSCNRSLYHRILAHGIVLSEYPPGTAPRAGLFPMRNRIISGLCQGVVVVEAGQKSGSLITADQALDQNRDVYAVPGPVFSSMSYGTHELIAQGAVILYDMSMLPGAAGPADTNKQGVYTPEEQKLLDAVSGMGKSVSELAKEGYAVETLHEMLSLLEIRGAVCQTRDGRWCTKT